MSLDRIEIEARRVPVRTAVLLLVLSLAAEGSGLLWRADALAGVGPAPPRAERLACDGFDTPAACARAAPDLVDAPRVSEALALLTAARGQRYPEAAPMTDSWRWLAPSDAALVAAVDRLRRGLPLEAEAGAGHLVDEPQALAERHEELRRDAWHLVANRLYSAARDDELVHQLEADRAAATGRGRLILALALASLLFAAAALAPRLGRRVRLVLTAHHLDLDGRRVPWDEVRTLAIGATTVSWRDASGVLHRARLRLGRDEARRLAELARGLRSAASLGRRDEAARRAIDALRLR